MRQLIFLLCFFSITAFGQSPAISIVRLKNAAESEKVKIYTAISEGYAKEQPDSAVYYANAGMRLAEKRKDRQGQAALLLTLGHINSVHHHVELARSFLNEALGIYRRLHDVAGIAHTYDQLGLLDGDPQSFNRALKYYQDSRDSTGLIETYEDLGKSYEEKGDREKALTYYLRALTQYEHRSQEPEVYFVLLETIAKLYQLKGDSATALHYLEEGIHKSKGKGTHASEVHLLNAEGQIFEQRHETIKALAIYKQALADARKYGQPDEQAEALIHIASILKKQDAGASIRELKEAMTIAKTLKEPKLEARIFEALAGVYRQQKNYGEAMLALEEQHHLLDSVLNADTVKDINALDSSYMLQSSREKVNHLQEINRIEKAELILAVVLAAAILIILLLLWIYLKKVKKFNGELQRLNEELTNSNRVKDTLFSVIGHDLKGPAGSAAQLFEVLETEDFTETEMRGMIGELRKQTKASLELLQSLFEWGKAQLQGVKVNAVDFDPKPVIDRCLSLLYQQAANKGIHLVANVQEGLLLHADVDHFEFVVRNLVSNAIKFSHKGSNIEVKTAGPILQNEMVFAVKDAGIGISKAQQEIFMTGNLQVKFGTHKEKGSGLGLLLTKDFIKANGGRLWLESVEGEGTTFFVALPVA